MYIIYDARHFEDYYSGLSRYSFSVLKTLILHYQYDRLDIIFNQNYHYLNNPLFEELDQLKSENIKYIFLDAPIFSLRHHFTVAKYVNNSKCDLYFYPHFDMPLFVSKKSVFVIHDLFPLILKKYILKFETLKKRYFKFIIHINFLKNNTHVIAVSKTTKHDILYFFGHNYDRKIKVIYEDSFDNQVEKNINHNRLLKIINDKKYLFYVGSRRQHKNLKQMIDIFSILVEKKLYDGYFLIAGSERNFDFNLEDYIINKKNIKIIGKITDAELQFLYSHMDALFFLSKYEGFGLPIVEAAKHNKKIITTTLGACGEVAPPYSLKLCIQKDNTVLAEEVGQYLKKKVEIRCDKFLQMFSWKHTVEFLLESIRS